MRKENYTKPFLLIITLTGIGIYTGSYIEYNISKRMKKAREEKMKNELLEEIKDERLVEKYFEKKNKVNE
jgi:membrane protein DedA with SNARE-associated domain